MVCVPGEVIDLHLMFSPNLIIVAMLFIFSDVLNVSGRFNTKESTDVVSISDDKKQEPYFEVRATDGKSGSPQNVSALIGKTAFLSCVVKNLGKSKSVSKYTI